MTYFLDQRGTENPEEVLYHLRRRGPTKPDRPLQGHAFPCAHPAGMFEEGH
jgi:hypothetical protein